MKTSGQESQKKDERAFQSEKAAAKFALLLSKKNLDSASESYIEAYELFQEGKISEVIVLLARARQEEYRNREHLLWVIPTIRKEKALLALQEEEQNQRQIQQLIETHLLKADALSLEFRYGGSSCSISINHRHPSRK